MYVCMYVCMYVYCMCVVLLDESVVKVAYGHSTPDKEVTPQLAFPPVSPNGNHFTNETTSMNEHAYMHTYLYIALLVRRRCAVQPGSDGILPAVSHSGVPKLAGGRISIFHISSHRTDHVGGRIAVGSRCLRLHGGKGG